MGVHINTVQGWESGRRPRGKAAHDVERVLGIDLDADVVSMSPRLDDATDAQLIANLAARLAARSDEVRELRIRLDAADAAESNPDTATGRWAARTREPADNPE